jgi:hypothetical protein
MGHGGAGGQEPHPGTGVPDLTCYSLAMLPSLAVSKASRDLVQFQRTWQGSMPMRIHDRRLAADGTPEFSSEFLAWVCRAWRDDDALATDARMRLTKGMKMLRDIAPREHDVIRQVLDGRPAEEIREWLNDRAIRGGHPERYSLKDTVVLIVSGSDKLAAWY